MSSCIIAGKNFSLDATTTKSSRHKNTVNAFENFVKVNAVCLKAFGINPININRTSCGNSAVFECLVYADIRIVKFNIFADHCNFYRLFWVAKCKKHILPIAQILIWGVNAEFTQNDLVHFLLLKHHRHGIENIAIVVFNNAILTNIAKQRDFSLDFLCKRMFCSAHDNIRLDTDRQHFLNRVLGRLAFQFVRSGKIRHKSYMDEHAILSAIIARKLTDSLQKRLALDIADCSADFHKANICARILITTDIFLDFVGNVRNDLNCLSAVNALSLVRNNLPVNSARSEI